MFCRVGYCADAAAHAAPRRRGDRAQLAASGPARSPGDNPPMATALGTRRPGRRRQRARAPARDREATEARILNAVGEVLARDGFGAIGVNAIAKQAGVDKVLIYRYFGGLPELLAEWGRSGRFWPRVDELLGADPQGLSWRCRAPSATRASSSTSSTACARGR